jgi:hypothetical protein
MSKGLIMADELTSWRGKTVVPIDENEPLKAGDRIVIRFRWFKVSNSTYMKAAELAAIDKKLEGRSDFRIIGYVDQGEYLDVEVEVLQSPGPEEISVDPSSGITQASLIGVAGTVAVVSICAAILGVTYALLYHSCYKYSKVVSGELPATVLKSTTGELATGLKVLSYTTLIGIGGYILLRLFGR